MQGSKVNKYVVIFQGRSGSKYLHELMYLHPEIESYTEVFHNRKARYGSSVEIVDKLDGLFREKTAGFQFRFPRQFKEFPEVVNWMERSKDELKVVFLYRRNKLKAAISQENVKNLKATHGRPHVRREDVRSSDKVNIDVEAVIEETVQREVLHDQYRSWVENWFECLAVAYEELCDDRSRELSRIVDFFGLRKEEYLGVLDSYESKLVKAVSNEVSNVVDNYDELVEKCEQAGLSKYL